MKDKWNKKYASEDYFFGKNPNDFFKETIDKLEPGKALFIGEGEGRNSVYAASIGWDVDAIDISDVGMTKAKKLADEKNVEINYQLSDAFQYNYSENYYDAIFLIYFHIDSKQRDSYYQKLISSLKPDGKIILLVYAEEHLKHNGNGPKDINVLYSLADIAEIFIDLKFNEFKKEELNRTKKGVVQNSTIIKFVGTKTNN